MTPSAFIDALAALRFSDTFNPYTDACPDHDGVDAPHIRRENLRLVLEAALAGGVDSIWIARDLGYRGGRRREQSRGPSRSLIPTRYPRASSIRYGHKRIHPARQKH
jgi:hypothetical protein